MYGYPYNKLNLMDPIIGPRLSSGEPLKPEEIEYYIGSLIFFLIFERRFDPSVGLPPTMLS